MKYKTIREQNNWRILQTDKNILSNQVFKTEPEAQVVIEKLYEIDKEYRLDPVTNLIHDYVTILYYDVGNDSYSEPTKITRTKLSKLYSQNKVIGAKHGFTVIEA